ncbi:deoxyribonuclease IV [Fundidesulfovibrio butyratiphilus]
MIQKALGANVDAPSPLGAHESIAGGLWRAVERIARVGGTALQLFTRNQRQWSTPPLGEEEVRAFSRARKLWGGAPVVSHASYLINLGSPDEAAWRRSVRATAMELDRCRSLGLELMVIHPGSALGSQPAQALARVAQGVDLAVEEAGDGLGQLPVILLENVAGQGTSLGRSFEELATLLEKAACACRMGLCLDTCHAFAAGYDFSSPDGFEATLEALDRNVGLDRLKLVHVNDSKHPLGSGKDRHEHIGLGAMGLPAFARIMTDDRLAGVPKVLETHKSENLREDMANLAVLRALARGEDAQPLLWRENKDNTGKVPRKSGE